MEEGDLQKRVYELEHEINAVKAYLNVDGERKRFVLRARNSARFLISNWVLLSFLGALAIATYVKLKYNVDYLESYRNIATNKKLSVFHRKMGDRLMASQEWEAAERAYRSALQLNANNIKATRGIVEAEMFLPLPGKKYWQPEVVDAKLQYLLKSFPDDPEIYFLESVRYTAGEEPEKAKFWLRKCIDKDPDHFGCYLNLGYEDMSTGAINEAMGYASRAVQLDPLSPMAKNNLGFCDLVLLRSHDAVKQFADSLTISPSMLTAINLGDAYRYSGRFKDALRLHAYALRVANTIKDPENDRYMTGVWVYNYMPLHKGDFQTIKHSIKVYTPEQKKALAHYALCIDWATLGYFENATKEFSAGLELEQGIAYRQFFQNKIYSAVNLVPMSDDVRAWLELRGKSLD